MRRPVVAANWKMHKTIGEAEAFMAAFVPLVSDFSGVDVIIAPPAPFLAAVARGASGSRVAVAAQNVHPEPKGAFTGEVSPAMLRDIGCQYTIVGHSERRTIFGESDAFVAQKAQALLAEGIRPIVCVGESLEQREAGQTAAVVEGQLHGSLAEVPRDRAAEIVVAYEPIWAIGTGKTATPEMAQEVHAVIRAALVASFGTAGNEIRIQYGGSVKPDNAGTLLSQPDIDGALVGGASLEPESFAAIAGAGETT
jgi:triosephosphate isomerase